MVQRIRKSALDLLWRLQLPDSVVGGTNGDSVSLLACGGGGRGAGNLLLLSNPPV